MINNTPVGSADTNGHAIAAAYRALVALCTRPDDACADETYLDFFYPIFVRPEKPDPHPVNTIEQHSDGWNCTQCGAQGPETTSDNAVPDICPHCLHEQSGYVPLRQIGICTAVVFDEQGQHVRITQTLKSYNDYTGEYSECVLTPGQGAWKTVDIACVNDCVNDYFSATCLRPDAVTRLATSGTPSLAGLVAHWALIRSKPRDHNVNQALVQITRGIQTMELTRLIEAIGVTPTPDFTRLNSHLSLFDGYVPYRALPVSR